MKRTKFAFIMQVTAAVTALLTCVAVAIYLYTAKDLYLTLAITFGTTCYHFAMRLLVGVLVPSRLHWKSRWFQPFPFESRLYAFLRVKQWKKQLPTYDPTLFSMKDYSLDQIISHMCQAEVVHEIIVVCSFLPMFCSLVFGAFPVFLITSLASACCDFLFIILQRFNRPRLIRILHAQERRSGIV